MAGNNPGRLFVDNAHSPRSGLIWLDNMDGFCFFCDHNNSSFDKEIFNFIAHTILKEANLKGLKWFECFGNHPKWEESIAEIFADRDLQTCTQHLYQLDNHANSECHRAVNLDEFELLKLTEGLLDYDIENLCFIEDNSNPFWRSLEDFYNKGIGFCVLHNNTAVSLCLSVRFCPSGCSRCRH